MTTSPTWDDVTRELRQAEAHDRVANFTGAQTHLVAAVSAMASLLAPPEGMDDKIMAAIKEEPKLKREWAVRLPSGHVLSGFAELEARVAASANDERQLVSRTVSEWEVVS